MPRTIKQSEYIEMVNRGNDFCRCCGDELPIHLLCQDTKEMPDLERPETIGGHAAYPLLGGFTVCVDCEEHCEDGPCAPDNLVKIVDLTEEGDHAST